MKQLMLAVCMMFGCINLNAQTEIPISVGYYGHMFLQPGVRIGTYIPVVNWQKESTDKKISLFANPQIGYFVRPGYNMGAIVNADVGVKFSNENRKKVYTAFSIGAGYLAQFNMVTATVDFSGNVIDREWQRRDYVTPVLNFEFGQDLSDRFGWYSKWTVGHKFSPQVASALMASMELGVKIYL